MADRLVRDENDAGVVRRDVDMLDGTHAERVVATPPANMLAGTSSPRLQVDPGSSGFFDRREFRIFREFATALGTQIPTGQRVLLRFVAPLNTILTMGQITVDSGHARITTYLAGTPTGAFSALPIYSANTMSDVAAYVPVVTVDITAAGLPAAVAITGSPLDVLRLKVSTAGGQAQSIGTSGDVERGIMAGTYFILIENLGADVLEGVLKLRWEERP